MSDTVQTTAPAIYGVMAEFETPADLLAAARAAREAGYSHLDAFTPFPVEDLTAALGHRPSRLPALVLLGGIFGGVGGFLMQVYATTYAYPLDVGGRPLNSWPMYIPITFELTILCAALTAVLGMLVLNRLPRPYHPVFNVPGFERATDNRFFLLIEASDPRFDRGASWQFLHELAPLAVNDVER